MTILDPCMSLEGIKKNLGVLGVVDMCQLLLSESSCNFDDSLSFAESQVNITEITV